MSATAPIDRVASIAGHSRSSRPAAVAGPGRNRRAGRRMPSPSAHLEVLGFVAAGIAHDVRNLLVVVATNLDALEHCPGVTEAMRERIDGMRELVLSGAGLTGRLARASGPAPHRTVTVPVAAAAAAAVRLLRLAVPSGIRIETAIDAPDAAIQATEGELESALINLVRNAVHAMPAGGGGAHRGRHDPDRGGGCPRRPVGG